ncbi:MAG TPA: hypothetical protein VK789_09895 [Bryobacteraceae bacterium]|nr:hypothetical protein [Bryobacteraceae bacterium]
MNLYRNLSALLAVHQFIVVLPAAAQQPQSAAQITGAPMIQGLKILVLEGQGATNNIPRKVAIQPVIEVRDELDQPVEGATVIFRLPPNGAGGFFPGQKLTEDVKTDVRGQAGATGLIPNDRLGAFQINVTATSGNRIGQTLISQTNSTDMLSMGLAKHKTPLWRNKYVLIGAASVLVAAIVLVATHSGSKNSTVTVTPGPVTVGQ